MGVVGVYPIGGIRHDSALDHREPSKRTDAIRFFCDGEGG